MPTTSSTPARRVAALGGLVAVALSLTACGGGAQATDAAEGLRIGVSGTDPGLAVVHDDGSFSGFDVDLASYVAEGLGWDDRDITFVAVAPEQREAALAGGELDMVVSSYPMDRDDAVAFAGPYFVAGQDLLVTRTSRVTGPTTLGGQRVCGVRGSAGLDRVREHAPDADLQEAPDLATCVERLLDGASDAVTGDDVALAGYAGQHPGEVKVVGSPFTVDYYGVALPAGSPDVAAVDDLLARAVDDGTWQADFERHFGASGWTAPLPPTAAS